MNEFDPRRYGLITGSKCSVLFPKKSAEVGQRTYAKELANQMYFRYYDQTETWQQAHGKDAETQAYVYYRENFCPDAVHKPEFQCTEFHGGSADCLSPDDGVDFKCPTTLGKWLDYLHVGIDSDQYYQAQMYMYLYKRMKWKVAAFLMETQRMTDMGEKYPVPENQRMICINVERESGWDTKLHERTPEIITMRDFFYMKLVEQFGPAPITAAA